MLTKMYERVREILHFYIVLEQDLPLAMYSLIDGSGSSDVRLVPKIAGRFFCFIEKQALQLSLNIWSPAITDVLLNISFQSTNEREKNNLRHSCVMYVPVLSHKVGRF